MVEHEYALDTDGNPIHIDDKNCTPHIRNLYFCPECKAEMVVKNQGQIKEHHFAHYNGLGGEGESPAHSDTILFLLEQLRILIKNDESLNLYKRCRHDNNLEISEYNIINYKLNSRKYSRFDSTIYEFYYNVLADIDQIEREYTIPGSLWRPDLALLSNGKVIRVIEVFYTNEDDPAKTEFYKENKIDVIKLDLKKNPAALSKVKEDWKYKDIDNTTIFCYTGCNVVIPPSYLIENLNVRKLTDDLKPLLSELMNIRFDVHKIESNYADLTINYKNLIFDISKSTIELEFYAHKVELELTNLTDEIENEISQINNNYLELIKEYSILRKDINNCYSTLDELIFYDFSQIEKLKIRHDELCLDYSQLILDIKTEIAYFENKETAGARYIYSIDKKFINTQLLSRIRSLSRKGVREIREGNDGMLDVFDISCLNKLSKKQNEILECQTAGY